MRLDYKKFGSADAVWSPLRPFRDSSLACLTQLRERISPDNRCELVDALLAAPAWSGLASKGSPNW